MSQSSNVVISAMTSERVLGEADAAMQSKWFFMVVRK